MNVGEFFSFHYNAIGVHINCFLGCEFGGETTCVAVAEIWAKVEHKITFIFDRVLDAGIADHATIYAVKIVLSLIDD